MPTVRLVALSAAVFFAVAVFVDFLQDAVDPVPEESISAGGFSIERWKYHYRSGLFYWESKLRYKEKTIDFCTPKGWGGSSLCDDRRHRGWFSQRLPIIVSDAPPAVLVPYGGTNDGELWLFTETSNGLEKRRVAFGSQYGIRDLSGERIDNDNWDFRKHEFVVLDSDTWLHRPSLSVLEFSRPVDSDYQAFV